MFTARCFDILSPILILKPHNWLVFINVYIVFISLFILLNLQHACPEEQQRENGQSSYN